MIGLTSRGRILEIALDLVIISSVYYLAFWLYYGFTANVIGLEIFVRTLPIALASTYISFFVFGIYSGVWQFIGLSDLIRFFWAVLGCGVMIVMSTYFLFPGQYPLSIVFLFCIFLYLGLAVTRSSFRLLDQIFNRQPLVTEESASVLIFGADDIGVMTLQWLSNYPGNPYKAIGFVDNDPFKRGRQIQGITVLGGVEDLESILTKHTVQGVILPSEETIKTFQNSTRASNICKAQGIWLKRLDIKFSPIE
jgi:FlaA1/EpsC-like NDP-sugar epimerase